MAKPDLETQFATELVEKGLVEPDGIIVIAVSGGPDSVALLHLFHSLRGQAGWSLRLHVVHLNHQLRGAESDADAEFVRALAKRLSVPITVESIDIKAQAAESGVSIEQAGRQARYDLYERVCLKLGSRAVALAHHADDNAETILYRIVRGTGLRGLGGIRAVRAIRPGSDIHIVRPLLDIRQQTLVEYLNERGITYREDSSNHSPEYTRNRIRHAVLPLLRSDFNPQATEALLRLGEQARGTDAYLSETSERLMESLLVSRDSAQIVLHAQLLGRKPRVIQTQVIRNALLLLGIGEQDLTYGHLESVAALSGEGAGNKMVDLPGGYRASRRYARLVLEVAPDTSPRPSDEIMRVSMAGSTVLPAFRMEIAVEQLEVDAETIAAHLRRQSGRSQTCYEEWLDADQVHAPLVARSRKPGDRFLPLGMNGMKKVSDFFMDEKIDPELRDRVIVLCDQLGPIWLVPFRIDDRVRLRRDTRNVLRLQARPMEHGGGT